MRQRVTFASTSWDLADGLGGPALVVPVVGAGVGGGVGGGTAGGAVIVTGCETVAVRPTLSVTVSVTV